MPGVSHFLSKFQVWKSKWQNSRFLRFSRYGGNHVYMYSGNGQAIWLPCLLTFNAYIFPLWWWVSPWVLPQHGYTWHSWPQPNWDSILTKTENSTYNVAINLQYVFNNNNCSLPITVISKWFFHMTLDQTNFVLKCTKHILKIQVLTLPPPPLPMAQQSPNYFLIRSGQF